MTAAKRKGTAHEVRVREYLKTRGFDVQRGDDVKYMRPTYQQDIGDIVGVPGWAIECKDTKFNDLGQAMNEAEAEAVNLGVPRSCVVMHRPRHNVREAYVVMSLHQFVDIIGGSPE